MANLECRTRQAAGVAVDSVRSLRGGITRASSTGVLEERLKNRVRMSRLHLPLRGDGVCLLRQPRSPSEGSELSAGNPRPGQRTFSHHWGPHTGEEDVADEELA